MDVHAPTLQPPSSTAWVTRSPSSPGISMPRALASSISSATLTPAAAGTTAFAPAPSGSRWRVGLDLGAAREKVRVARALATLPRLAQALARGELSYAKVRALTRVATPETEERLLAIGRAGTAEHVERIVRGWRRMDRKAERDEATRQHTSRALYVYPAEDGTVTIRGRLSPEAGALLLKALTAAREALYQRERARRARPPSPRTFPRKRRRWLSSKPTPCSCWPRPRSTTASIRARRPSTTRWWSMSTASCSRMPISPASPSSKMAHAFPRKRPSAWAVTRVGW